MTSKVLFLTSAHPGGRGMIGAGEGISEGNLRVLIDAGHEVHVLCLAPPTQSANRVVVGLCASYTTLNQSRWEAVLGVFNHVLDGGFVAPWFFTRGSPRNVTAVTELLSCELIRHVWIEFPSCLGFTPVLKGCEVEYFAHDVVSQKVGRQPLLKYLRSWVARVEGRLVASIQRCHVMSDKDAGLLLELGFVGTVVVSPPQNLKVGEVGASIPISQILNEFTGGRNLVFFGNMQRPENHKSIMHFLISSFPAIRRRHPDVQLWILGLGPRWTLKLLARIIKGVRVTGAIDDPTPAFAAATLCVAPLRFGAGVKIKVLQMLGAGAYVITTPIGAEGVPASERLVVVEDRAFAQSVIDHLDTL